MASATIAMLLLCWHAVVLCFLIEFLHLRKTENEKKAHSSEISVRIETKVAANQLSTTHRNEIRDENLLRKLTEKKTVIRSLKLFNYFAQELIIYIQRTHYLCV